MFMIDSEREKYYGNANINFQSIIMINHFLSSPYSTAHIFIAPDTMKVLTLAPGRPDSPGRPGSPLAPLGPLAPAGPRSPGAP